MIEMQMAQHHHVDVLVRHARLGQRIQQHVVGLDNTEALTQLGLEERADAGLQQDATAVVVLDQQCAACQRNAVLLVGCDPFRPHRLRHVAEHGAAVELL